MDLKSTETGRPEPGLIWTHGEHRPLEGGPGLEVGVGGPGVWGGGGVGGGGGGGGGVKLARLP